MTLPRSPQLLTLVLMVGTSVMSLNLILPALGSLADSFGLSYATASFVFSGYLIVTGGMTLVMGPLSDRFGRRPIVLTALSVFIVASLCSAAAPNVVLLFVFRFFQAVVVGAGVLAQAAVRDTSASQSDTTRKLALIAMAMALVPLIGPMVGGVIADLMGWRAVFMAQAGVGALTLLLCVFDLNETNQHRSATFLAQFRAYPGLVSSLRFWGYVMTLCMGVAVFFSFLAGMPLIAKARFGFGETLIGVMLGTLTLGYLVANGVLRQISDRFMQAGIMVFARALGVVGPMVSMVLIALGFTNPIIIFAPLVLMGAANGLSLPLANSGIVSVRPDLAGSAAGLSQALVSWIGAVCAALVSMLLTDTPSTFVFLWALTALAVMALLPSVVVLMLDRRDAAKPA